MEIYYSLILFLARTCSARSSKVSEWSHRCPSVANSGQPQQFLQIAVKPAECLTRHTVQSMGDDPFRRFGCSADNAQARGGKEDANDALVLLAALTAYERLSFQSIDEIARG